MSLSLAPPSGCRFLPPEQMTRDARAQACWLALIAGWPIIPDTWAFDPDTNNVVVSIDGRGATWGAVREPADAILERIERAFGGHTRARVETAIG